MSEGYLNLVLHAHLPFVYNVNDPHYLEERWFFEAVTDSYLPLLIMLDRLSSEQISGAITVSLSPTLLTMLDHPILSKRFVDYLERLIQLSESEVNRTKGQEFNDLALFYLARFNRLYEAYTGHYHGDLPSAFAAAAQRGQLELITTCATHGFLPLMKNREAVKAQIGVGLDSFTARFGFKPQGMWLPECGYFPGLDVILAENEVRYVFLDTHGVRHAVPTPQDDVYSPVQTRSGVAFFARDPETSAQVWSIGSGYPGDFDYREYYRDIGFDLPQEYIRGFLPYNVPVNTGLKYYRVTGEGRQKELYRPEIAYAKAKQHAGNFHFNRERQIQHWSDRTDSPPVITAPYDAELFGHWWFEGPEFIEAVVRIAAQHTNVFQLGTPSGYLDKHGCTKTVELYHSSWGEGGYSRVWLNPSNDWIYPEYHSAEEQMISHAAAGIPANGSPDRRMLNQLARELLLAQSSDWAFMINAGTTVRYANNRVNTHLENIHQLETMLKTGITSQEVLATLEEATFCLFPDINPAKYAPKQHCTMADRQNGPSVLMLSWEYPPQIMGGLARHVDDLSKSLANGGQAVNILTSQPVATPVFEMNGDICVYRVAPYQKAGEEINFHDWVVQLNLVFFNLAQKIIPNNPHTVLHAHDWLVGAAALAIRHVWHLPLVATIHATEHGRNGGIFSSLQHKIHLQEKYLVEQADRVICCSKYMANEIIQLFGIPADKVRVIQNGVVPENIIAEPLNGSQRQHYANDDEYIVFFVGRLVKEKGVEILLEALPHVLEAHPNTKTIISGKGPMLEELAVQARQLGIADRVIFTGFITDFERNRLFATADVAVFPSFYEPFGIVALEAMAAGVPLVVSEVGGMGEVVENEKDALTVTPGNAKELAEAVKCLLSDKVLRERLKNEGRLKAATVYSWDRAAVMTSGIYRQVWEEYNGK